MKAADGGTCRLESRPILLTRATLQEALGPLRDKSQGHAVPPSPPVSGLGVPGKQQREVGGEGAAVLCSQQPWGEGRGCVGWEPGVSSALSCTAAPTPVAAGRRDCFSRVHTASSPDPVNPRPAVTCPT